MEISVSVPMDRYVRLKITDTVVTKCSIRHSSRLPMLVVSVFLMGVMASYTSADTKQGKPIRPTFVRDAMVEVPRAGSVEITLEAIPSYGNQEAFEIQSLPEHGTISGIKNLKDSPAGWFFIPCQSARTDNFHSGKSIHKDDPHPCPFDL